MLARVAIMLLAWKSVNKKTLHEKNNSKNCGLTLLLVVYLMNYNHSQD